MTHLLRAIVCLLMALCMASVSYAAAGHSVVVVDESAVHAPSLVSELPCSDCGSHRVRFCGQACNASSDDLPIAARSEQQETSAFLPPFDPALHTGMRPKPPLTPPIA